MVDSNLSRRAFLAKVGTSAAALAALHVPRALAEGLPELTGSAVNLAYLPTPKEIRGKVKKMTSFGPRLTGSPAHRAWIDYLELQLSRAGVAMSRDHFTFTRWTAQSWGLQILEGPGSGPVPVSSYFPYSGATEPGGLEADMAYVGPFPILSVSGNLVELMTDEYALARWKSELRANVEATIAAQGSLEGRIALVDALIPPLQLGDFLPLVTYTDPTIMPNEDYKRVWIAGIIAGIVLQVIKGAGAIGAVFAWDASPACAAGQYAPYAQPIYGIPALYVDRDTGTRLRELASETPRTRLTLVAQVDPQASSDSLVGLMPGNGSTNEVMILNTHTDGQNAFEENGGVALVALAHYFKKLGRAARNRTLVFSAFTGHFGPGLPQTQGLIDNHPDLIERAAASMTLEHFGSTEWLDDARGFHPTGKEEPGAVWHSQTGIVVPAVEAMKADSFIRTSALRPAGKTMISPGAPLHEAGVPSLCYIPGPTYLVSVDPHNHLDKLDPEWFHTELVWAADIVQRLDKIPVELLKAGDTTVWGS